jgi:PKD repeat protein
MSLSFSDQSTMANGQLLTWQWDFGDGTISSQQNPVHTFTEPGQRLVCLTAEGVDSATGVVCLKTACYPIFVPDDCFDNCLYEVMVDVDGSSIQAGLSPAPLDTPFFFYVNWSLDDGTVTGNGLSFNALIAEPGVHTLCATYPTGDFTAETCTVCKVFEVTTPCVDSTRIDSIACPLVFMPVCGCDGVTYGNSCEAEHWGGVTSWRPGACGSVCNNLAIDFEGFNSGGSLTYWTFNDLTAFSGGQVTSWFWDFGNGQSSNEQNPSLNFLESGDYQVCLFISGQFVDGTQCGTNLCKTIHIGEQLCADPTVIDTNVLCPAIYQPVCGCDGVTYSNECVAYYQNGITTWTPGICGNLCVNPAWIDTTLPCIEIFDPVCGCDENTYVNECFARKAGVTSWKIGACCGLQSCQANFSVLILPDRTIQIVDQSVNPANWQLTFGDGLEFLGGFDTLTHTYDAPGIYQVCLQISNFAGNCSDQYCTIVDLSSSAVSDPAALQCSVTPNPSNGQFTIKTPAAQQEKVSVLDVFGHLVWQQSLSGTASTIDLGNMPSGVYFLRLATDNGNTVRKLVLQH